MVAKNMEVEGMVSYKLGETDVKRETTVWDVISLKPLDIFNRFFVKMGQFPAFFVAAEPSKPKTWSLRESQKSTLPTFFSFNLWIILLGLCVCNIQNIKRQETLNVFKPLEAIYDLFREDT